MRRLLYACKQSVRTLVAKLERVSQVAATALCSLFLTKPMRVLVIGDEVGGRLEFMSRSCLALIRWNRSKTNARRNEGTGGIDEHPVPNG